MDRFVEKTGVRSYAAATMQPARTQPETPVLPNSAPDDPGMEVNVPTAPPSSLHSPLSLHPASPSPYQGDNDTDRIAQAVAALLSPMITASVEKAVDAGMRQVKAQLGEHSTRLHEVEHRLSSLEEEVYQAQATEQAQEKTNQYILQKLDDLENRSRRSNLRFVGVPESLQSSAIAEFCARRVPEALGLPGPFTVERAHRMGTFAPDRKSPRPIIAKYLNYNDKTVILQKFRQNRSLEVDGIKILIFADYSMEVSKKRKAFQHICTELHQRQMKFTLAFPATLRIKAPNGDQLSFQNTSEAEAFLRSLRSESHSDSPLRASPNNRPLDQRSPRKDSPKRFKSSGPTHRNTPR